MKVSDPPTAYIRYIRYCYVSSSCSPRLSSNPHLHPLFPLYLLESIVFAMSGAAASGFSSKLTWFMNHPAGPKTIFFYAPLMKWCIVLAGVKDMARPADKLVPGQNAALATSGMIWVRNAFQIIPKNYGLAAVNFFVGTTGFIQLGRIAHYRFTQPQTQRHVVPAEAVPA
ncbi:hypothetical protein PLICRDRAFT_473933 [Plicaturopsis crispa FD-325 SS-3]|nr:hypothetical protein PLICRDRAFT_473933 [Plicaturopsis crispa FD-325 SS-3]